MLKAPQGLLSLQTFREGVCADGNQMGEKFGRDESKNKLAAPSTAATKTNLLVFHAYVRAARAR